MSKFLNIPSGNYKIKVKDGGNIVLDTSSTGDVIITGNLQVLGSTSTISSTTTTISDNIITLNSGEVGAGVTTQTSGIEIDRGSEENTLLIYDELNEWVNPDDGLPTLGNFSFETTSGNLVGIKTNSITTDGGSLNFLSVDNSTSGILYTGFLNIVDTIDNPYSERILNYSDPFLAPIHLSAIPNVQAMVDYVDTILTTIFPPLIEQLDTKVQAYDFDQSGTQSRIEYLVDGTSVMTMYEVNTSFYDLLISDSTISSVVNNADLSLLTSGSGSLKTNAVLEMEKNTIPTAPVNGVKIYSNVESTGGTGIYFINESGTSDELVSVSKLGSAGGSSSAIVYSLIFSS